MNKKTLFSLLAITAVALIAQPAAAMQLASQLPPADVRDFVIHNKGNVAVTVANWGYVGGFRQYGYPSGEYPKGTGRNYLAEIKYWMGAVKSNGDTVVVDTDNDLMPIPFRSLISGINSYDIRISTTDSTYDFNLADTVGLGAGYPAYGWQVWNPVTMALEYNQIWDPISHDTIRGGPLAQQESHFRMGDDALAPGNSALNLEVTHTVYQWNYSYNEDYLFLVLQITNRGDQDYDSLAFGIYADFDVGGDFQGENGRLDDLVAFDRERNLAWTYDRDNYDPGWGPNVVAGVMGTMYIETPDGIGMTAFRTGEWVSEYTDGDRFALIGSDSFDESLPPTDQYYIQCTRGINLEAGKTVRVVYALIAAPDSIALKKTADMAQMIYDHKFIGPEPPKEAALHAKADDRRVKLWWDNLSETTPDRCSGEIDFQGYKVYRSTDFGLSWGKKTTNSDGSIGPGYDPIATFEKLDSNDLVAHSFIDTTIYNGFDYWYSVVAYDAGEEELGLKSLATAYGTPGYESNAVLVRPRSRPAGYYDIQRTLQHTAANGGHASQGSVTITEYDAGLMTGSEYQVRFSEDPYQTYWHVINAETGDTLLKDQTDQTADPELAEVVDGFSVLVEDGELVPTSYHQTEFATSGDTTLKLVAVPPPINELAGYPLGGGVHFRSEYEIRFTATGSQGYWWWDDATPVELPFEVWNMTTNEQVNAEIIDWDYDGEWTPLNAENGNKDYVIIVNWPYDGNSHPEAFPYYHIWTVVFNPAGSDSWGTGDVLTVGGAPINGADDVFSFKTPGVEFAAASSALDNVKVVPNPYVVNAEWESEEGQRRLEFVNLPDVCTVRIYTLAGDLVKTIEHTSNGGTAAWDLSSSNAQGVAPGIYFYSVDSKYGSKIGKFAVIK
jgi:hypothetical protein